ncbi:Hint domain-containing protein [bacterium]|nr:Hint domain-containing protein [bacterium]
MATFTFIAHTVNIVGGGINVVGSSTFVLVLDDDDSVIGEPGDTGETASLDGGAPQPYTYLGLGITDNGEEMLVIEIDGVRYAFDTDGGELANGNTKVQLADLNDTPIVPCFTPGAMILTPDGPQRVETLCVGDVVSTRDCGPQPIRAVLRRCITCDKLRLKPHLRPIRIKAGALGENIPDADLLVSPQHCFLIDSWRAEVLFGEQEVLATAKSLTNDHSVFVENTDASVEYIHLILDQHQIVYANGALTETVLLSHEFLSSLKPAARLELTELFPEFDQFDASPQWRSAARVLKAFEGRLL